MLLDEASPVCKNKVEELCLTILCYQYVIRSDDWGNYTRTGKPYKNPSGEHRNIRFLKAVCHSEAARGHKNQHENEKLF